MECAAAMSPEQQQLFATLRGWFPNVTRAEVKEAIRLYPQDEFLMVQHILNLNGFTTVTKKSNSGVERPLQKRQILARDLTTEYQARFRICTREILRDFQFCYPSMAIICDKCKNTWTSVGFPAEFGFYMNHDRWSIFGEVTIFRQQCKQCKEPLWPMCDAEVINQFLHTISMRIEAKGSGGRPTRVLEEKKTHKQDLCEGCDVHICRFALSVPQSK